MNLLLSAFCVGLFHLQDLPWYMGVLAYGSLAANLVYILVLAIVREVKNEAKKWELHT